MDPKSPKSSKIKVWHNLKFVGGFFVSNIKATPTVESQSQKQVLSNLSTSQKV